MMLDAYAACEGDSSAVVAIQNKYLEEARLKKQSRSRGKHVQEVWIGDYMPTSPLHSSSHPDLLLLLLLLLLLFYFTFWKNLLPECRLCIHAVYLIKLESFPPT